MTPMKGKIKKLFQFIGRAWTGGIYGKFGIILAIFAFFLFIRIFWGDVNIQRFAMNIFHLRNAQEQLIEETATLNEIKTHIKLIQNYSPDYIEELGLRYLNIGDPRVKILKY